MRISDWSSDVCSSDLIRRFLADHLQKQKFDYRQEWRRLLQRISAGDLEEPLDLRVVKALADLLDSPAGALWYLEGSSLALQTTWNLPASSLAGSEAAQLIELLREREAVIALRQAEHTAGAEEATPPLPPAPAAIGPARLRL